MTSRASAGTTLPLPGISPPTPQLTPAQQASAPDCPPAELRRLAASRSPAVRAAVAQNPATPLDTLLGLAHDFPDPFAKNPALELHLLERPDLLKGSPMVCIALARASGTPAWLLERAFEASLGVGFAEQVFADCPRLTSEQAGRLCLSLEAPTRVKAAVHPRAPQALIDLLVRAGSTRDLKQATARRKRSTPEGVLREAAALGPWGAVLAASHPWAPCALLAELARHLEPGVRDAVAGNRRASPELLVELALDSSPIVAMRALFSETMTADMVRHVAQRRPDVLPVYSPAAPADLLATFASHPGNEARMQAARHPNTAPEIVAALARDPVTIVRQMVSERPDLDLALLAELARDGDKSVADAAKKALKERKAAARKKAPARHSP